MNAKMYIQRTRDDGFGTVIDWDMRVCMCVLKCERDVNFPKLHDVQQY